MKNKSTETTVEIPSLPDCPLDFNVTRKALVALKKVIADAQQGHKQLLDETVPISLYLHVHKIPRLTYFRLSSQIPHPFVDQGTRDVCLFVRDDETNGREYEGTIRRYKTMIEQFQLPFHVDVMTLKQLNQELVPYEAKRKLCARYDLFLADRRIIASLMRGQLLGKHFRHHNKMPIGINVFNKDLKQRLIDLGTSIYGRMSGTGPLFSIPFTTLEQAITDGMENLRSICEKIGKEFPGGWQNVAHAHLYGNNSQSLPIYYSPITKNEVTKLNPPSAEREDLTTIGELNTLEKNLNVIVEPDGNVHLTKRKKLKDLSAKKNKKTKLRKRLQRSWLKGVEQLGTKRTGKKSKKEKKTKKKTTTEEPEEVVGNGQPIVDTAFVQRVAKTRLAAKNEKQKHVEQDYATQPAPRAEKRKRLLAAAKQTMKNKDESVPTLVDVDEEKKIKSGGRSKKKVRL